MRLSDLFGYTIQHAPYRRTPQEPCVLSRSQPEALVRPPGTPRIGERKRSQGSLPKFVNFEKVGRLGILRDDQPLVPRPGPRPAKPFRAAHCEGHSGHDLDRRSRDGGCQMPELADRLQQRWGISTIRATGGASRLGTPPAASSGISSTTAP